MVKDWIQLARQLATSSHARKKSGLVLLEGKKLVRTVIEKSPKNVSTILALEYNQWFGSINFVKIDKKDIDKIKQTKSPQPIFAITDVKFEYNIEDLLLKPNLLLLDNVQNPDNVGALIRSAVGFGVDAIFLYGGVNLNSFKLIRASSGYFFDIAIVKIDSLNIFEKIKQTHSIYTTVVSSGRDINSLKIDKKSLLILGNEGQGVCDEVKEYFSTFSNNSVTIKTDVESLNVAVAGSILMYEIFSKN